MMKQNRRLLPEIPKEKFEFADRSDRMDDQKLEDKPIGYFKDAWNRFRKNKASIVAAVIILLIILYAIVVPFWGISPQMDTYYKRKGPRVTWLANMGLVDGGRDMSYNDRAYIKLLALGMAAEDSDGSGKVSFREGMTSAYQPVLGSLGYAHSVKPNGENVWTYKARVDEYLAVGFLNIQISQEELADIEKWESENGVSVLYPLIDDSEDNPYFFENAPEQDEANYWYKTDRRGNPVRVDPTTGTVTLLEISNQIPLQDNYLRDSEGNVLYSRPIGGGNSETSARLVRVLYYNYYQYQNHRTPNFLLGTDSQGYDMALRLAKGIRLSLLVAVFVSLINFFLGGIYGAIEGYYGGLTDLVMERLSDILAGVPFIVVATLFQIHLAQKVGPIPSMLFAFVVTGWIGTASRMRMQFYRFKNQEYVMAARTLGARDRRIIWKHIFPNTLGTLITSVALVIPSVVFNESMLSYLGIVNLGGAESTSLGTLLSDASSIWTDYPHLMIVPAVVISLLMICFNLFGNGLRDAFNPSLRGVEE